MISSVRFAGLKKRCKKNGDRFFIAHIRGQVLSCAFFENKNKIMLNERYFFVRVNQ